jgi:hypothetical protein
MSVVGTVVVFWRLATGELGAEGAVCSGWGSGVFSLAMVVGYIEIFIVRD